MKVFDANITKSVIGFFENSKALSIKPVYATVSR